MWSIAPVVLLDQPPERARELALELLDWIGLLAEELKRRLGEQGAPDDALVLAAALCASRAAALIAWHNVERVAAGWQAACAEHLDN
jgi:hypothetical protein